MRADVTAAGNLHGLDGLRQVADPPLAARYIELLVRQLTGYALDGPAAGDADRAHGFDWPERASSMIGLVRMRQLADAAIDVVARGVPGDLCECGVWRAGACILMRAVLGVLGDTRTVWVADSFAGLPAPDDRWAADTGDVLHTFPSLAIPVAEVQRRFAEQGWLDDQVRFVPGWFSESLPGPIGPLALLRVDGDMYGSVTDTLRALYPLVVAGGVVIVDDYGAVTCGKATRDYLYGIGEAPEITISADGNAGMWRK